jgi:hypothetical protein
MQKPALYFPYVHIRDDEWLKAAALYWPSVHRLVPHGYAKHDSATAQVFVDEEILQDEEPGELLGTSELGTSEWDLSQALSDNAELLVDQFSVERARTDWDGRRWAEAGGPDWELPALGWIHATKFPPDVAKLLSSKGLAARGCREMNGRDPGHPEDWLGLHPALAGAYMTALAARLSAKAHFEPLTDQADLRIASPRTDIRAALSLLLGQSTETGQRGPARGVENYVMPRQPPRRRPPRLPTTPRPLRRTQSLGPPSTQPRHPSCLTLTNLGCLARWSHQWQSGGRESRAVKFGNLILMGTDRRAVDGRVAGFREG